MTDGFQTTIRNQGQRTILSAVVWGEPFFAPRNVRIEDGHMLAWDAPQKSHYPLMAYVVRTDKGISDTLGLSTLHYPCGDVTASYSVASKIPFAMAFIPSAVMVFAYPYFAKNNSNRTWVKSMYLKMTGLLGIFNLVVVVVLILIAPYLISFLFGDQYDDAVLIFRVLMLSYFMNSTFKIPSGNIIITQMKIKFNTVVAVVSGALNIGLNVLLTMKLGSIGAAITTTTIIALSGIANFVYMLYLLFRKTKKRKRGNTPMEEHELSCMESHASLSGDDTMQDSDTVK